MRQLHPIQKIRPAFGAQFAMAFMAVIMMAFGSVSAAFASSAPASFADLAERLSPAVVNISTSQTVRQPERPRGPRLPENSPFRELFPELFGGPNGGPGGERGGRPRQVSSLGSGFVISADGYIVTNNHVIEGADEIHANFADGSSLDATLIGTDPKTDIALLKVESDEDLVYVPIGDSDTARVGDWVLAIGNPFGLGGSVSAGIISARNRDINAGPYDDFIQTDAAINKGNSGGPLFNMDGEVIGVNTAIISPSGGSIGIGFSVPSTIVTKVVAQLKEYGQTRRGWLGVQIQQVTDELAEGLGLDEAHGALVADIVPDSPAMDAGVEVGDVIIEFNGEKVDDMRDLPRMVAETPAGSDVDIVVLRKGEEVDLTVNLGLLEEPNGNGAAATSGDEPTEKGQLSVLGMELKTLTGEAREMFEVAEDAEGVLVVEVSGDGAAAEKGVQPGDVITEVGQQKVSSPSDVDEKVKEAIGEGRKTVLLLVNSGGNLRFVALPLSD